MRLLSAVIALSIAMAASAYDKEYTLTSAADSVKLGGTLTIPTERPKAVLVLATGSGQQNRDEEILGHKPFKRIADKLEASGYAVLRLDDRGIGASGGDFEAATDIELTEDIHTAVNRMKERFPDTPVGVLGHSEGGSIAIRLGARGKCSFIITLAAPAWKGDSLIMSQGRAIATALTGRWDGEKAQRQLLDIAEGNLPTSIAKPVLVSLIMEQYANLPQYQPQAEASAQVMLSEHYRRMLRYDPAEDIQSVQVPWLALNGSRDLQVLPGNLSTIAGLCPAANIVLLDKHNHLFQHCTTGLMDEYAKLPEDISEETLQAIVDWLDGNFGLRR